ncbi:hypothetical protein [uncultured Roseovarius sp.]|uniref:hypothetical protein n=1 Tax=uncultured Roseovarius sp. TaxID=293344 RepID=UPI00259560A0|nr:hypothetical protein [uncultured Roseovarius sp.]
MSKFMKLLAILLAPALIASCANDDTYPVSGEECASGDPVQDMNAAELDCVPPAG